MMISVYTLIAYMVWTAIFIIWTFKRFSNKKTLERPSLRKNILTTILLYSGYLIVFIPPITNYSFLKLTPQNLELFGIALCFCGAIFSIWARVTLGKNWSGLIITQKTDHELIKNGPYGIVRHPIYSGFLLAIVGFSLTTGLLITYLAACLVLIAFLLRIKMEEKLMNETFPDYKEYSKKVYKLVPFIW